jgi:hypothetical protein
MTDKDRILNSPLEEVKKGFKESKDSFQCLMCAFKTEKGIIYQGNGIFYDASRFMLEHIHNEHSSVFDWLIELDKKDTGLSDHQKKLLKLFREGKSDADIQKELGIGSSSTIRNHRFALKEKERQAKIFLALMELLKEDSRYTDTEKEKVDVISKYFEDDGAGRLKTFSMKEKNKLAVLKHIMNRFETDRSYTEKEVNEIIGEIYDDFVTIRRYLIEFAFMDRKPNGSSYWVKAGDDAGMERKRELMEQYKEIKTEAGVYQIRNKVNGKIMVASTQNLKTLNGKKFELNMGSAKNILLQKEWNEFGEAAFEFELLEKLEKKDEGFQDIKGDLRKLEEKWLQKLEPYGDKGYNSKKPDIK